MSDSGKFATTAVLMAGLAAAAAVLAPAAHASGGVAGSINSPLAGTVNVTWSVYVPASNSAHCTVAIENSANTAGTYREFDYPVLTSVPGRNVSGELQAAAPAGSTANADVYCTFLHAGTGQSTVGQWVGSTSVKIQFKGSPGKPPLGGVA